MLKTVIYFLCLFYIAVCVQASIFEEDFSTDPFADTRWVSVDSSDPSASAGFTYDSINEEINFISANGGSAILRTVDPCNFSLIYGYDIDLNFKWVQSDKANSVIVWFQRQLDESHYYIKLNADASTGELSYSFGGGGITTFSTEPSVVLNVGNWYVFHAEYRKEQEFITLKAYVFNKSDGALVKDWSVKIVDHTMIYDATNSGFALECSTENTGVLVNHIDIDDFVVTEFERECADGYGWFFESDISGIKNLSDCRVNLFDFAVLAGDWLQCTDPINELCD